MQEDVAIEALAPVLRDLRVGSGLEPSAHIARVESYPASGKRRRLRGGLSTFAFVEVELGADRILIQVQLDPDSVISVAQYMLASRAQDLIIEHLGEPWPKCPGHPHPMNPHVQAGGDDKGAWVCPSDSTVAIDFGQLEQSR